MKLGAGNTKVGTKLDFNIMGNPFSIKKLTEKQAIKLIKNKGLKFRREKDKDKVIYVYPIGDTETIRIFLDNLIEQKIYIDNSGIKIM